jgi:hypothetical protein
MPRIELPPELPPEERRAVVIALERALAPERERLSPWALAGRAEATRRGALQVRRQAHPGWTFRAHVPFAGGGPPTLVGRGDAR